MRGRVECLCAAAQPIPRARLSLAAVRAVRTTRMLAHSACKPTERIQEAVVIHLIKRQVQNAVFSPFPRASFVCSVVLLLGWRPARLQHALRTQNKTTSQRCTRTAPYSMATTLVHASDSAHEAGAVVLRSSWVCERTYLCQLELDPSASLAIRDGHVVEQWRVSHDGGVGVAVLVRHPLAAKVNRAESARERTKR